MIASSQYVSLFRGRAFVTQESREVRLNLMTSTMTLTPGRRDAASSSSLSSSPSSLFSFFSSSPLLSQHPSLPHSHIFSMPLPAPLFLPPSCASSSPHVLSLSQVSHSRSPALFHSVTHLNYLPSRLLVFPSHASLCRTHPISYTLLFFV